jgi:hypothetical protein
LSVSDVFARAVALIGGAALLLRRSTGGTPEPAWGGTPAIPAAKSQGSIPTLKMPTARGWSGGQTPVAAPGLKVNAFATDLDHPRWIQILPNGDVLIAESMTAARPAESIFDYAMVSTMKRADAMGVSANRITLLRDGNCDGVAETRLPFLEGLNQPFGMALVGDTFTSATLTAWLPSPTRRMRLTSLCQGDSWPRSCPADTGREAYCRASMGRSCSWASVRSPISAMTAWMWRRAGPPSTSSIWQAAGAVSLPPVCATLLAWHGNLRRACSGRWSTSATDWGTRRRRII